MEETPDNIHRRKRDQEDHDLLVEHNVKLDQIVDVLTATNVKLEDFIKKIDIRCDTRATQLDSKCRVVNDELKQKLSNKWFMWLIGILITCQIIVTGLVGTNSIAITEMKAQVHDNSFHINETRELIKNLHESPN